MGEFLEREKGDSTLLTRQHRKMLAADSVGDCGGNYILNPLNHLVVIMQRRYECTNLFLV